MTKVNHRKCDVCGDKIGNSNHLRLKRRLFQGFIVRLFDWGLTDIAPGTTGWRKRRVDLCVSCWGEVTDEVQERVTKNGAD